MQLGKFQADCWKNGRIIALSFLHIMVHLSDRAMSPKVYSLNVKLSHNDVAY